MKDFSCRLLSFPVKSAISVLYRNPKAHILWATKRDLSRLQPPEKRCIAIPFIRSKGKISTCPRPVPKIRGRAGNEVKSKNFNISPQCPKNQGQRAEYQKVGNFNLSTRCWRNQWKPLLYAKLGEKGKTLRVSSEIYRMQNRPAIYL